MLNNVNTNVERIIAKIDNDFNPDQSDWIPRVGAWVYDALAQTKALCTERKKIKLIVHDRIAYSTYPINSPDLAVTDAKGCKIDKQKAGDSCDCGYSTGEIEMLGDLTPQTISIIENDGAANVPDYTIANTINNNNKPPRYNIQNYNYASSVNVKSYVIVDDNKLQINFDANCIYVVTDMPKTEWSDVYNCELPVVPNSGILIEAIAYYCLYKMLCRGYKHPLFNLAASQYGTNPYYEWNKLKPEAKRAVIIDAQGNINVNDGNLFQSALFITTFK